MGDTFVSASSQVRVRAHSFRSKKPVNRYHRPIVLPPALLLRLAIEAGVDRGRSLKLEIKRVYDEPSRADGTRILVDRLWPRGLSKERARVDLWLKDIAPSTDLRKWFSHDPKKWTEFQARYRQELKAKADLLDVLKEKEAEGPITLLYGAKDEVHNEAVVLQSLLQSK
jgi:uncharacterized protein YeaO (DUF488 family)